MDRVYLSIFLLFYSFISTEQLTCLSDCSNTYVKYDGSVMTTACTNTITSKICKAQIIAYYDGKTFPEYFNYTFGLIGDSQEKEHINFVQVYGLTNFLEYQFIVNAKKNETILITDIYCTKTDNCALIGIEQLLMRYNKQINPFYKLKPLIYSDLPPKTLTCYDSKHESKIQCSINPVCTSNSKDSIKTCSSDFDVHLHYNFTISSPKVPESTRSTELIICNKDNCNDEQMLIKLENIAKHHIYDPFTIENTANGQYFSTTRNFFGFLTIIVYCIV
jgi:hypothetical protein